jgi:hypothetical protein
MNIPITAASVRLIPVSRHIPVNRKLKFGTDSDLLAQECFNNTAAHDVLNDHHQRNRFSRPPDPSALRDVHLQQQSSNVGNSRVSSAIPAQAQTVPSQALLVPSANSPPGPLTGSTTKLCAYPHKFHEVIEHATRSLNMNVPRVSLSQVVQIFLIGKVESTSVKPSPNLNMFRKVHRTVAVNSGDLFADFDRILATI